jgi:hypothetical protein
MSKLRVEQWKNEPADIFAIRAFVKAMPQMDDNALHAMAFYIWERAHAEIADRPCRALPAAAEGSPK